MGTFRHPAKPAFVFPNPGVEISQINSFLLSLCAIKRAPAWIHLMYINGVYPKAVMRLDFFKSQPNEPSAYIYKPVTGRAEMPSDVGRWVIETAWALGSEQIMHHRLAPTREGEDFQNKGLAMMHLAKILHPSSGEGDVGKDCVSEEIEAMEKGCWIWSFNILGSHWNELTQSRRGEALLGDPALWKRNDGFRTLPVPQEVYERILSHRDVYITFAEAQTFRGSSFVPRAATETGDPFLG